MEDEGASYGAALKGEAMHPTSTSRSDLLLLCLPSLHRHGSNSLKMTLNNFNSHFYALLFYFIFVFSSHNNSCYTQHVLYGMSCIVSPSFSFSQTFFHSMYHPPLACFALPSLTLPYLTLPYLALPCLVSPYLTLQCHALPCHPLPCHPLPCPAIIITIIEAQALGFAEADPTADVEGHDVQAKICILAKLAYGSVSHCLSFLVKSTTALSCG